MKRKAFRAFSMVELLMVIALMLVLASFALPALSSIAVGSNLHRAGQIVGDQMALARQEAVTRNCDVEVRLCSLTNAGQSAIRAIQLWRVIEQGGGSITNPIGRLMVFPEGVVISPDSELSPLLSAGGLRGEMTVPSYGSVKYEGFRIRPSGMTDTAITATNNFLTLQNIHASGAPPANYYTLQINPVTGRVTVYRP